MVNHLAHKLFPDSKFTGVYADGITTQGLPTEYTEGIYTTHNFERNMDFICNAVNCFPEYQSLVGNDWNDQTYGYALASQANRLIGSTALGLKCSSVYGSTSLYTVPAELSLCVTLQITAEQYEAMTAAINILGSVNGASWFNLIRRRYSESNDRLQWEYKNSNVMTSSAAAAYSASYTPTITDGQPHKLVCCISAAEKKIKAFLDGVLIGAADLSATPPAEFQATNSFSLGTRYPNLNLQGGGVLSNVKYFNFDISASGAPYTLEDYQNDKDVPSFSYLLSPSIYNTIGWDRAAWFNIRFTVKSANGEYLTTTHTGADIDLGGNSLIFNLQGFLIKFKKFHFRVDDIRHNLANAAEQNTVPKRFWVEFTYVNAAGTTQSLSIYNNSHFTASDFPVVLDYDIPEDWQYIKQIRIHSYFKNGKTAITEGDSVVYKNLRVWVEDFESINYPEAYLKKISNGKVLELQNKLSGTTWQDESGNGYDVTLRGDYEIAKINTVSIEDYLNSLKQDSNIGNILVNNNLSYDFEISQYKQQPLESLAIIFTAIALDNIAKES